MSQKTMLLLGATGATGKHVLEKAVQDGVFRVVVYARNPDKLPATVVNKIQTIQGDLMDHPTLKAAVKSTKPDTIIITSALGKENDVRPFNQLIVPEIVNALKEDGQLDQCKIIYLSGVFSPEYPDEGYGCIFSCLISCFGLEGQVYDNTAVQRYLHNTEEGVHYTVVKMGSVAEGASKGVLNSIRAKTGAMGARIVFVDMAVLLLSVANKPARYMDRASYVVEYAR